MTSTITIRNMTIDDIDQVLEVEHASFPTPWTRVAFENEILNNRFATYYVAEADDKVVGYSGVWVIIDEAHITNIAVLPDYRGLKLGETLLRQLVIHAKACHSKSMTLEVRVSNTVAMNLYEKIGFQRGGVRKGYYTDNHEDAYVMWVNL
jgi:ribosomal-protein-alanine N-acetyltransferase